MYSKIEDKKINVALVGGGGIAFNHLSAIKHYSKDLNLMAVCDKNLEALNSLELESKVLKFTDYLEMIELEDLDLISICTPSGLHPQQTLLAAERFLNVMTEKPMSIKWQDGLDMVEACKKSNTRLFVVKQNRYNKYVTLLKEAVDKGLLGKIYLIQSNVFWTRPQSYYDAAKWRGTKEHDGGALMNQSSHYVDLLHWLFGPITSVNAITSTSRKIETEDTGVLNLCFESGAIGSMNYSMLTYPKNYEGSITVIGEKGTIKIGGPSLSKIEKWDLSDNSYDKKVDDLNSFIESDKSAGHKDYYNNVIGVLRGEVEPICDGEEGLKSLEILIATYLSSDQNQTIHLPLEK